MLIKQLVNTLTVLEYDRFDCCGCDRKELLCLCVCVCVAAKGDGRHEPRKLKYVTAHGQYSTILCLSGCFYV